MLEAILIGGALWAAGYMLIFIVVFWASGALFDALTDDDD